FINQLFLSVDHPYVDRFSTDLRPGLRSFPLVKYVIIYRFFFNDAPTPDIYTLSLHDALPIFMRTLPTGSVDPNFGRRVRNRRQLNSLQNTWPYGYSMPIAVRYTQDAFSRSGWLWPVDAKGEPLKATSYMAVGFYVAKY